MRNFDVIPELGLPWFTGKQLDWINFIEEFESLIDTQDLSDEFKSMYLRRCLNNDMKRVIEGYPLMDYPKAVDALRHRFGKRCDNLDSHINAILDLKAPSTDPQSLLQFYDKVQYHFHILGRLDFAGDDLLLPIIKRKLPGELRAQIYRTCKNLYQFTSYCQSLYEVILSLNDASSTKSPVQSGHVDKGPCAYCKKRGHSPLHCTAILSPSERLQILKTDRLCFNCLGPHQQRHCRSKFSCKRCGQSHHTTLHDVVCDRVLFSSPTSRGTSRSACMQSQSSQKEISPAPVAQQLNSRDFNVNESKTPLIITDSDEIPNSTLENMVSEEQDEAVAASEIEIERVSFDSNSDWTSVKSVEYELASPLDSAEKMDKLLNPSLENIETSTPNPKPVKDATILSTSNVDELHNCEKLIVLSPEVASSDKVELEALNDSGRTTDCTSEKIHSQSCSWTSRISAVLCLAFIVICGF